MSPVMAVTRVGPVIVPVTLAPVWVKLSGTGFWLGSLVTIHAPPKFAATEASRPVGGGRLEVDSEMTVSPFVVVSTSPAGGVGASSMLPVAEKLRNFWPT